MYSITRHAISDSPVGLDTSDFREREVLSHPCHDCTDGLGIAGASSSAREVAFKTEPI